MELRTMRYFLAVAREENMTRAAELLHVTQPTLSKQLKILEEELGKKLFTRHSFSIQLTEEGILLRKRAEDLVKMADKITTEFLALDDVLGGDVYFGLAESYQIRHLAGAIKRFKDTYPDLHYHITSGDTEQVTEKLDKGIIDFAVLAQEPNTAKYHYLHFLTLICGELSYPPTVLWRKKELSVWRIWLDFPCFVQNRAGIMIFLNGAAAIWINYILRDRFVCPITVHFLSKRDWAIF